GCAGSGRGREGRVRRRLVAMGTTSPARPGSGRRLGGCNRIRHQVPNNFAREGANVMKWVTRENANVDRIACPWLIRRFIDPDAEFLFGPRGEGLAVAGREGAHSYSAPCAQSTAR